MQLTDTKYDAQYDFSGPEEEPLLKDSAVIHWIFESWVDFFLYSLAAIVMCGSFAALILGLVALFYSEIAKVLVLLAISFFLFGNSVLCYRSAVSGALQRQSVESRFNRR